MPYADTLFFASNNFEALVYNFCDHHVEAVGANVEGSNIVAVSP
jgi:hypothetical protein